MSKPFLVSFPGLNPQRQRSLPRIHVCGHLVGITICMVTCLCRYAGDACSYCSDGYGRNGQSCEVDVVQLQENAALNAEQDSSNGGGDGRGDTDADRPDAGSGSPTLVRSRFPLCRVTQRHRHR